MSQLFMSGLKIVNINPIKMKSLGGLMKTEQDIINLILYRVIEKSWQTHCPNLVINKGDNYD